jgi:hypothetical protein
MSNNGSNGKDRIAKAAETRSRKKGEMRDHLFETVSQTAAALLDWSYAYNLNVPQAAVRLAFYEDPRFVPLMRAGKIAVLDRALKYPKWADHLTDAERKALPTVAKVEKLPPSMLPVSETGNEVFDADVTTLEEKALASARSMPPRRARAEVEEQTIIFGRMITMHAEAVDEAQSNKEANRAIISDRHRLEAEINRLKRQVSRLEGSAPPGSHTGQGDEARPN